MRITFKLAAILLAGPIAIPANADPVEDSCDFLAAMGQNNAGEISPFLEKAASHWPEKNRNGLATQLSKVLDELKLAGGNVYLLNRFGEDVESHLVLLRLEEGEVAGAQLRYEWAPDGMRLVTLSFKRKYEAYSTTDIGRPAEQIPCP